MYAEQQVGFVIKGSKNKVYSLEKVLYGLRHAPRASYSKINDHLMQQGFEKSDCEPTFYQKEGDDILLVCLYEDDVIYMGSKETMVEDFKQRLMCTFEMSDLGLLHYFLGLEVKQEEDGVFISQRRYAEGLLKRFQMEKCKSAVTSMNVNEKLQVEDGTEAADAMRFRSLVGGLMYLTNSRPDIACSVSILSRFMQAPSKQHYGAGKRILRYISGTLDFGIWYSRVPHAIRVHR